MMAREVVKMTSRTVGIRITMYWNWDKEGQRKMVAADRHSEMGVLAGSDI